MSEDKLTYKRGDRVKWYDQREGWRAGTVEFDMTRDEVSVECDGSTRVGSVQIVRVSYMPACFVQPEADPDFCVGGMLHWCGHNVKITMVDPAGIAIETPSGGMVNIPRKCLEPDPKQAGDKQTWELTVREWEALDHKGHVTRSGNDSYYWPTPKDKSTRWLYPNETSRKRVIQKHHETEVRRAWMYDKPVPASVLADYPDSPTWGKATPAEADSPVSVQESQEPGAKITYPRIPFEHQEVRASIKNTIPDHVCINGKWWMPGVRLDSFYWVPAPDHTTTPPTEHYEVRWEYGPEGVTNADAVASSKFLPTHTKKPKREPKPEASPVADAGQLVLF